MIHKSRALIFGHRKLKLNPIDNACSNGSQFKYYISILGGRGVQNLVKHAYIIHEWSLKTISLKFSLEHFKQFASLPHLMFYPWFFISDYYRSLSIAIALKYYYQYHYHYRYKSHYSTCLGPTTGLGAADGHHHPLIARFHPTSGPHDPHSLRWAFPSELSLGVYIGVTFHRLG